MGSFIKLHSNYVEDLIEASKVFPSKCYSLVPTILFLLSVFPLMYIQFHKYTNTLTKWKTILCKNVVFHWTYFYATRLWFMFLKVCRWARRYSDRSIERNSAEEEVYFNQVISHFCLFMFVLTISLLPCIVLYVQCFNRREIPNFLMWVAEDPWVRSEIGTSGHYLERPPRADIYSPYKRNASYRSGRSSSVDTNVYLRDKPSYLRSCKSAINVNTSTEVIIG